MDEKVTATYSGEAKKTISKKEAVVLEGMLKKKDVNIPELLKRCKVSSLEELTNEQYSGILEKLNNG